MTIWDFVPLGIVKAVARRRAVCVRCKVGPMGEWFRSHFFAGVVVQARNIGHPMYHVEADL